MKNNQVPEIINGHLMYLQIDYEIYNSVILHFDVFTCMGTIKQEIGDRETYRIDLFGNYVSADCGFSTNDHR